MEMTNERYIAAVLFAILVLIFPFVKPIIKEFFGKRKNDEY